MNQFLNDEEIAEIIKEYIYEKETDSAILINGEWGSGKTYFVKNKIIKEYENQQYKSEQKNKKIKFIYISTYGVKNTNELDNKIFDSIIGDLLPKEISKFHKVLSKGISSIYDIAKAFKELPNIPKDSVRNLLEILQSKRQENYILIFDDLERCEMPITELLGYINEFVEHKSMKTIIIANEKEILKNSFPAFYFAKFQVNF